MPSIPDLLLFSLVPLGCLAVALYFAGEPTARRRRPISGLAAGASVAGTLAALMLVFLPGEAYYVGLKGIVPVVLLWLLLPLLAWNILPGIVGPTIGSPLAYLGQRFGDRTALLASVVYLVGRLLLSGVVLAVLARMLSLATGGVVSPMLAALGVGLFATACNAACGTRGGTWLSTVLVSLIALGVPFGIAAVIKLTGGPDQIWEIGQASQRTWIADPSVDLSDVGVVWNLAPWALTALLVLLLGDEASATRLSQLRTADQVRAALVTVLITASILAIAWMYTGLGVFVFYRQNPQQVRPKWVTNIDPATGLSLTDPATRSPVVDPATGEPMPSLLGDGIRLDPASGEAILPWDEADVTLETIDELVRRRRIYNVNTLRPINSIEELLDDTDEQIDPTKLASYSLAREGRPSEMLLHRRATEEIWPYFLSTQAPEGMRGLLLGALLAAALAAVDMTGVIGSRSLNRLFPRRSVTTDRVLTVLASLSAMLLGMLGTFALPHAGDMALYLLAMSLTPVAALVMLGLTSRRATAGVAFATLAFGVALGALLTYAIASRRVPLHPMWSVTLSFGGTWLMGQLLALVFGATRRHGELRGLVLGPTPIGALHNEEPLIELAIPDEERPSERWRR